MIRTVHAIYDGKVLRLEEPVDLEPNTHVRIAIEKIESEKAKTNSFLQTARSLSLEGPADWSTRLEEYLYGSKRVADDWVFSWRFLCYRSLSHNRSVSQVGRNACQEDRSEGLRLITTRAVVLEIGNALAKLRYRSAAVQLLRALEEDPNVEIVPLSEELYKRGLQLYRERLDKEWSLTDCISITVMQERGLTEALTTDKHFQQAGFEVLLD